MILQIFTVYDCKTQAYLNPFYDQSIGSALRNFEDTVKNPEHIFNKHSEDFTLFHLGQFDDQNCEFTMLEVKTPIILASEVLSAEVIPFTKTEAS